MQDIPELTPRVAEAVVRFLRDTIPVAGDVAGPRGGWGDLAVTAYEIGCDALVSLGQADITRWGAAPKSDPRLPEVLPFWEDVAVAVLWLAHQQNLISYRQLDGSLPARRTGGFVVTQNDAPPPPSPNIATGPGSGPALAEPIVRQVLEALGLVQDARWTVVAEVVHWRGLPLEWALGFEADVRFQAAVEDTVNRLPPARHKEIERLMRVSATEVAERMAKSRSSDEQRRASSGMDQFVAPAPTVDMIRRLTSMERENALDWIFFRHWRLGRGWLDEAQAARALEIFHDRLAIAMRRAVVARLYPGGFVWE